MRYYVAAAAMILGALVMFSTGDSAQEKRGPGLPFGKSLGSIPFEVVEQNGSVGWKISGRGEVAVESLMAGLASAKGQLVTYSASATGSRKQSVPYVAPESGRVVSGEGLSLYVSDLLASVLLTIISPVEGRILVISTHEAAAYSEPATLELLPGLAPELWVTLQVPLKFQSQRELSRLTLGGSYALVSTRSSPGNLLVSGRADHVRRLMAVITAADEPSLNDQYVVAYSLSSNESRDAAAVALHSLFPVPSKKVLSAEGGVVVESSNPPKLTVSAPASGTVLLVRATRADHEAVMRVIEALKP